MLENFIYAKEKSLFEEALNNGEVLDEAIVFIEDTKEIWNHGTYFDGSAVDLSNIEASIQNILDTIPTKVSQLENDNNYVTETYVNNAVSTKQDVCLKFSNLSASTWVADTTYSDFGYRCDLTCSGVTADMYAEVVFEVTQAASGSYAPVCETGSGIVSIWSSVQDTITVPVIIITK